MDIMLSLKPYFIVFIASACGLIIEIVAARILAPVIGVSLYTWTSIIGVVLAGISAGNYLGGRLADRFPSPTNLGFILLAGGLFSLSILPLIDPISEAGQALPLIARIIFLTTTLFFLPSLILGMVTPVVIKHRLLNLTHTGSVVGKIYALSTAGSIFGVFITGFVLIQWIGTRAIILVVALVLVAMALVFGNLWRAKVPAITCLVLFLVLSGFIISNRVLASDYLRESSYYSIQITDTTVEGRKVKTLRLDALVHSTISLEDPTFLTYSSEKIFADIATYVGQQNPSLRVLHIGGGGYVMPRYLEEVYPQSTLEVIEIDPEVTRVVFDYLGLSPDTNIVTYNQDARMVIPTLPEGRYDLVIGDAFNDLSVPYHLTTREFNEQVQALLKDDGIYVINVVDKLHSGRFLRAYVNTIQRTFPYVYLIEDNHEWEDDSRRTHVVAASLQPLSLAALKEANTQAGRDPPVSHIMPEDALTSWLNAQANVLLTDDYAPVDSLVAPLHLEKYAESKAKKHLNAGVELENQGKLGEAIAEYDEAIRLDPSFALAYSNRGAIYARLGQFQQAIQNLNKAIYLDPRLVLAHYNRGLIYAWFNQHQLAIKDFSEVIHLNLKDADAYYYRGISYREQGKRAEALADFQKSITLTNDPYLIEMAREQLEELSK